MMRCRTWAAANLCQGDTVIPETTGTIWAISDSVGPLVTRTVVAHAGAVRQIADARGKPDTEDLQRLFRLLIAAIVPDVWGAACPRAHGAQSAFVPQPARNTSNDDSQSSAKQYAQYALMKVCVETDITRYMRKNVPRRVALKDKVLARMKALGCSLSGSGLRRTPGGPHLPPSPLPLPRWRRGRGGW
jgi:hypothetical protein